MLSPLVLRKLCQLWPLHASTGSGGLEAAVGSRLPEDHTTTLSRRLLVSCIPVTVSVSAELGELWPLSAALAA